MENSNSVNQGISANKDLHPFLKSIMVSLAALMSILGSGCNKDDFNASLLEQTVWTPEVAFPLVHTEMGIADLAQVNDSNTTLIIDENQFCTLLYNSRAFEVTAQQLLVIPDQNFSKGYGLNANQITTLGNTGTVSISKSHTIDFSLSQGAEIDSMFFKSGDLELSFSSDFPLNGSIQIIIPGLNKNGIPLATTLPVNYNGSLPVTVSTNLPLAGYKGDFTEGGTVHNRLRVDYTIVLNGSATSITTGNRISCNPVFKGIQFSSLYGYAGQQNLTNFKDSVEISIFSNSIGSGSFSIAGPKIRFDISNSLGLPISARVTQLLALNGNLTSFVVATGVPDPLPVNSPGINQIGQSAYSSIQLDHTNSNITSMIDQQPKYLISQTQATTNPAGHSLNFLLDSSKIAVDVHVELPFYGTANNFKVKDTVPFSYNDLVNVSELMLRMDLENGFPLESSVQLIFTDDQNQPLDTLFNTDEVVIPSGTLGAGSERVSIPGKKSHDQFFDATRITKILNAKNIIIVATATSTNAGNTNVKIFADYQLKIKIGAIAKMKIQ